MSAGLLNGRELAARLGLSRATYQRRRKAGALQRFEVRHPLGVRRYSAELVDAYLAGKQVAYYGRRVSA